MDPFLIILLASSLLIAAVQDLRFQKIPNLVTYPTMGIALVYHLVTNRLDGLLFSAGGLGVGIAIFILPYLMGGMGAGDAKLMGAVGTILGPKGVFIAFLFTAVIGGVYALILLLISRRSLKGFISRHATTLKTFVMTHQFIPIPAAKDEKKPKLCYGIAIALGTLLYVFLELSGYNLLT
ncbi:MAG: prepilin peptidase [Deltaproteobacteria bacterium]|nr:prepilin peptidase [Deltaproteobacteria bacterium]